MVDVNKLLFPSRAKMTGRQNMIRFICNQFQINNEYKTKRFKKLWFDSAKDLYQKDLVAHYGCVNAIEFSNDGDLLFSGGDDRRILMWRVDDAMIKEKGQLRDPTVMKATHASNVFCLAVDSRNKWVLSGGNDNQVVTHDYKTEKPVNNFMHESSIFCISITPDNSDVYAAATDDGKILLLDQRERSADASVCVASFSAPFHGVVHHPLETALIATANAKLGMHIWDVRKPLEPVQKCCSEQGMAVRWSSNGRHLLCIRNLMPPMLFDPVNPNRHLEFDAKSYYIACTMKSCCFAGDCDEYILSGSDDFNVHMWKIPEPWPNSNWVGSEQRILSGHRSIVNQVRYCPNKQLIASSGVEKVIKLWSPDQMPSSCGDRDRERVERARQLCSATSCNLPIYGSDLSTETVEEDRKMLHFFDRLLREEFSSHTSPVLPSQPLSGSESSQDDSRTSTRCYYSTLVRRKKKYLVKTMTDQRHNYCSICNIVPPFVRTTGRPVSEASDSSGSTSDDSGMNPPHSPVASSDSSISSRQIDVSSSSDSEDAPSNAANLKDSGVNLSHSSDEATTEVVRRRVNQSERCYRIKSRSHRASPIYSSPGTSSSGDSASSDRNGGSDTGQDP